MKRLLLASLFLPATVFAIDLTWDHPTSRVPPPVPIQPTVPPGTPTLTPIPTYTGVPLLSGELKESRLYNKRQLYKILPYPTNVASVTMQGNQNYAWEVTAVDKQGQQSDYSNALVFQATPVPTLAWPPLKPGSLRAK